MKTYLVTATAKYQAWDGTQWKTTVRADSKAKAISVARRRALTNCVFSRQDGAISYSAEEIASDDDGWSESQDRRNLLEHGFMV